MRAPARVTLRAHARAILRARCPRESALTRPALACDAPLIDDATVSALLRLGGERFLGALLDQFALECAMAPPALCAALRAGDVETFHALLHGLGSAAGNLGARRVFARCVAWRAASAAHLARSLVALRRFAP